MVCETNDKVAPLCTWEPHTNKEKNLNYIETSILPHPWFKTICINDRPIGAILVTKNSRGDASRPCETTLIFYF
ncbi:hypothetical protein LINPERPRIM_LOCUS6559 [Linum perenne]